MMKDKMHTLRAVAIAALALVALTTLARAQGMGGYRRPCDVRDRSPSPSLFDLTPAGCVLEYDYEGRPFYTVAPTPSIGLPYIYRYRSYNERSID